MKAMVQNVIEKLRKRKMRTEMIADSMIPSEEVKEDDYKYELS